MISASKPLPKRLLAILERFDVETMAYSEGKTALHAEGGEAAVLRYGECSAEQKAFLDSFAFSSFRSTYLLQDLHRDREDKPSLIDIPARSGIAKITLSPAPFSHTVLRVGEGNTLLITEDSSFGDQPSISSIELHVDQGSSVDVVSLLDGSTAPRILVRSATVGSDARLDWHPHLLAGSRTMLDIHTLLDGSGAESNLFGTYLGRGEEEYYLTYESTHRARDAKSNMVVHGCLMDRSLGIFNGQVTIEPTGHGTATFVGERCLLLGDQARHGSTPALSVNTNDVTAGHSSATSQIDEEQLFYAASRGLPVSEAKDLIVQGFLQTMLDHIPSAVRIDLPESLLKNESRGWNTESRAAKTSLS